MPPVVPFPGGIVTSGPVGHISPGQSATGDMSKAVSPWKPVCGSTLCDFSCLYSDTNMLCSQLPLLKMSEPEIRTSHHMCVPEGTGVTTCKNVRDGLLAESTYLCLPDYYELMLELEGVR